MLLVAWRCQALGAKVALFATQRPFMLPGGNWPGWSDSHFRRSFFMNLALMKYASF